MTATPNPPVTTNMTMTAHEETYRDPFAELQASPTSTSSCKPVSPHPRGQTKDQPAGIATPSLKKKVSFPDTLTRGRGTSYTPPEDDKNVRFSTSLVRGQGPSYNERYVERDSSIKGCRASNAYEDRAATMGFDTESASDDSFTDVVRPINMVKASKTEPRPQSSRPRLVHQHQPTWSLGSQDRSVGTSAAQELLGSIQANFSDSHEATRAKFDSSKKRRNIPTSFSGLGTSTQPGTASAPIYNRQSLKLRPNPIDASIVHQSSCRSWPQPIFVFEDTTATTSRLSRPKPAFALRERSESQNNIQVAGWPVVAKSSLQRFEQNCQLPSVDENTIDGEVRYDPDRKKIYRDV